MKWEEVEKDREYKLVDEAIPFRCGIRKMVDNVVEDLMQITYLPNFRKLRKESNTNYQFLFGNGSSITVRVPNDTCRGHRMHSMVVDPDIDSYTLDTVIRPYEIEYIK